MMRQDIKCRWVAALRSGDYTQGIEALRLGDKYCCLGVLTDLYVKDMDGSWEDASGFIYLPDLVSDWAEVRPSPGVRDQFGVRSLASLNDNGFNFEYIADLIEADSEL